MTIASEISKYFYNILNVSELTSLIDGSIYREKKPINSELQDIVINTLFLKSGYKTDIQNGQSNINIYCKSINSLPDLSNLNTISEKVIELLDNNTQRSNSFFYEILDTNLFQDLQQNTMFYINIKLQIHKY